MEPSRRMVGHGPLALTVVAIAAGPYLLTACAPAPTADGELDVVQVCASRTVEPVRLPDSVCDAPGGGAPRAEWVYQSLPPSPRVNVPQTCEDMDGYEYDCSTSEIDTDGGNTYVGPVFAPVRPRGSAGPLWLSAPPPGDPGRIARGVAPMGGTLTRSGAGTGGWGSPGSSIMTKTSTLSRQPSPAISRGGLGSPSTLNGSGSGPRGGSSSGS